MSLSLKILGKCVFLSFLIVDIDECVMMPHLCRNGRCKNTIGSFHCECADGYILNGDAQHCKDIDECKEVQ